MTDSTLPSRANALEPMITFDKVPIAIGMVVYQIDDRPDSISLRRGTVVDFLDEKGQITLQETTKSGKVVIENKWDAIPGRVHSNSVELLETWLGMFYKTAHYTLPGKIQALEKILSEEVETSI